MNRRRCLNNLPLAAFVMLALVAYAPQAGAQANCLDVTGALQLEPDGSAIVTGDLAGILYGEILDVRVSGDGALHLVAAHHWVTARGDLFTMSDEVVLAPVAPPLYHVNNRMTVVGGTGEFTGATGGIHVQGLLNLATGEDARIYHGRICLP
jgi:hypothetical protein